MVGDGSVHNPFPPPVDPPENPPPVVIPPTGPITPLPPKPSDPLNTLPLATVWNMPFFCTSASSWATPDINSNGQFLHPWNFSSLSYSNPTYPANAAGTARHVSSTTYCTLAMGTCAYSNDVIRPDVCHNGSMSFTNPTVLPNSDSYMEYTFPWPVCIQYYLSEFYLTRNFQPKL